MWGCWGSMDINPRSRCCTPPRDSINITHINIDVTGIEINTDVDRLTDSSHPPLGRKSTRLRRIPFVTSPPSYPSLAARTCSRGLGRPFNKAALPRLIPSKQIVGSPYTRSKQAESTIRASKKDRCGEQEKEATRWKIGDGDERNRRGRTSD
jgi:hypothetical protein